MSERGVFAVDRGIWEHPSFTRQKFTQREAWIWLIGEASFRDHTRRIGSVTLELKRGQLAASLRFMAEKWGWKEPTVRRFLKRLKTDGMIDASTDAGITVITICNYNKYQKVSLPRDAGRDVPTDAAATQQRRKEESTESTEGKSVVVVGPKGTMTATEAKSASPKRPRGSASTLGTPLPNNWKPDEETVAKVLADYGMTFDDVNAELPGFHAYNLHQGTMSPNWNATFCLWAKNWKERRLTRAAPFVELNRGSAPIRRSTEEITEQGWDTAGAFFANTGRWMRDHGPDPTSPCCKCPKDILIKHGINPNTGERQIRRGPVRDR